LAAVPDDPGSAALTEAGIDVHHIPIDPSGLSPFRDLRLLLSFTEVMRKTAPSAYFGFTAKPNIYGSLAASKLEIPVMATISGLGTAFLNGLPLQVFVSRLYRRALRHSARVFFHNDEDRELFVDRAIVRSTVAQVIPGSGVDLKRFSPVEYRSQNESPTFLFVGRILKDKGALEFIQAAAITRQKSAAHFQMLGALDDHPRAVSSNILEPYVRDGTVELLGLADDVRPFIANADCIVLPSYREGLPRAILEASAMGRPVIASNVAGCRQAVDDHLTGIFCEPRSSASLAEAISKIIAMTEDERRIMGLRGRKKVEMEFSEERVVNAYLGSLAEIGL
jgi:glycosyltransferase involved in cell wall biosynthesis